MIVAIISYIIFFAIIYAFIRNIARKNKQKAQRKDSTRSNIQIKAKSALSQNISSNPGAAPPNASLVKPTARLQGLDYRMFENRENDWLARQIQEERKNKGLFM